MTPRYGGLRDDSKSAATRSRRTCTCGLLAVERYLAKISGPLLDRIDIHIEVPAVPYKELSVERSGEPSETIRERVNRAQVAARAVCSSLRYLRQRAHGPA